MREPGEGHPDSQKNDAGQQETLFETNQSEELSLFTSGTGIYVSGLVNHSQLSILLDTGATCSILSEESWKKSGKYCPEKLEKLNATLTIANGDSLNIEGKTLVTLRLGNLALSVPMLIVRNIPHTCILGSDFFHNYGCQILYDLGTLIVRGEEIPIYHQKRVPRVCRVLLKEKLEIQPIKM